MTAMEPKQATQEEIASAYVAVLKIAARWVKRPDELAEVAKDAATDAVMWAKRNYQTGHTGTFEAFAKKAARVFIGRRLRHWKNKERPRVFSYSRMVETDAPPAREVQAIADKLTYMHHGESGDDGLTHAIRELPDDLKQAVSLFYVYGFSIRDCAALLDWCAETVRLRLIKAARVLGDDWQQRVYQTGARRFVR